MFNTIANLKYNSKGEKLEEWNVVGSIMAFDITPRMPIFRVIIGNQIVVALTVSQVWKTSKLDKNLMVSF